MRPIWIFPFALFTMTGTALGCSDDEPSGEPDTDAGADANGLDGTAASAGSAGSSEGGTGGDSGSAGTGGGAGGGGDGGTGGAPLLTDGTAFTLHGQGFGTKPEAAPIKYDDFEQGTPGAVLSGWETSGNTSVRPVYDSNEVFAGQGAALIDFPAGTYNNSAYLSGLALPEVYFSYRVFVEDRGGSDPNPQLKYGRATSADVDFVHGTVDIGMTLLGTFSSGNATWYNGGSAEPELFYGRKPPMSSWARIEHYLALSNPPGTPNGKRYAKMNFEAGMTFSGYPGGHFADPHGTGIDPNTYDGASLVTRTAESGNLLIQNVVLPFFTRSGQLVAVWVDEVYVDSTQARVEIGNYPHWDDCTRRSPQPASLWADDQITIRLNRGDMEGEAFGFVVTATGSIVALGKIGTWQ